VLSLILAQMIHLEGDQPSLEVLHNSCTTGTCGLPDMSTLLPSGLGNGCTYQADHSAHVTTINCDIGVDHAYSV